MTRIESEINKKIIMKLTEELALCHNSQRQMKNVLRIPRLNEKYRDLMDQITTEEQLRVYLKYKLDSDCANFDKEGRASIKTALEM